MVDEEFLFEAGPFEMSEEMEAGRPRGGLPPGGFPRPLPSTRGRHRPRRRVVGPLFFGPYQTPDPRGRCEVLLVLEGYTPSSPALAPHHEPMLERLTGELRRMGTAARSIEVVAVTPSSRALANGDLGDRRTDAVVQRLKELLESRGSQTTFRRLTRKTAGPARVEIRICRN